MNKRGLIVFIRNPEIGKVKTRLAAEVGQVKALGIYIALLDYTRKICLKVNAERYLYYFMSIADDDWDKNHFNKRLQSGLNLGENMRFAFQEVLQNHDKAIIIGSDCPQITDELVEMAYAHLASYDLVIGPTFDGGYYLLGMKKPYDSLFQNISWSTDSVLGDTLLIAIEKGLSFKLLDKLSDVDYKEDWEKYGWKL